ncbi:uncharacterized protein B0H18DRAFT_1209856, partial [Fomitopsis serialis]|uniref:uncharacterized protein n=1 Tax=Fomitopsis serialis TaxID=139415 RepID=UPI002008B9E3
MISLAQIQFIRKALLEARVSLSELVLESLDDKTFAGFTFFEGLNANLGLILAASARNTRTSAVTRRWAHQEMKAHYHRVARELTDKDNGWHLGAVHMKAEQVLDFRIEDMAARMRSLAPELWELIVFLLSGRELWTGLGEGDPENQTLSPDELELWRELELGGGDVREGADPSAPAKDARLKLQRALCHLKTVVILSVIMHSLNQQCNAFAAVNAIFFHSCNTPDKVIKALAHMGISISPSSINNAVHSLSRESARNVRQLGQSLRAMLAYDNCELTLRTMTPTIEKSGDRLVHLTSGLIIKLEHGVQPDDLRCSRRLWETSWLNPSVLYSPTPPPRYSYENLLTLHPDPPHPSGLSRSARFTAWLFLDALFRHGPEYFRQFIPLLPNPEAVELIPVVKLTYHPVRCMDINQSKVDGNIQAIADLLKQAGIGDPEATEADEDIVDISEHVVLVHGDLGTAERVQAIQKRRSIEQTALRRHQFAIFVPGIFHSKMACADDIWRMFIQPPESRRDENSLMHFVGMLRPRETGQIGSKPKFRQMHEVILHTGIVLRLDCWRTEARSQYRDQAVDSLDDFARQTPTFEQLVTMAHRMVPKYVAGVQNLYAMRNRSADVRDQQHENIMLMHQYFSLYEEFSYHANAGDIGGIEAIMPAWIALFKATGKHKYASYMERFWTDVHFVYPERLRHAIRYNILVNPTGKPHAFRGVDWVVELMNLFTKDTYGGDGSNYTKDRVITESPNVLVYS